MSSKKPFGGLVAAVKGGMNRSSLEELTKRAPPRHIALDQIRIVDQERKEFEDSESSLLELGESLKRWQLHDIVVRPIPGPVPYELIAGERRYRAATLVGLGKLRAHVIELSDEEAHDARLSENIHRKNLTLIEEARALQHRCDTDGVKATLLRINKSHAWLSKRLALLNLPEQAQRVVSGRISADPEVINGVRQIEKLDPEAAAELVDTLAQTRGQSRARTQVAEVMEKVKGPKAARSKPKASDPAAGATPDAGSDGAATPLEQDAGMRSLEEAYLALSREGQTADEVVEKMTPAVREAAGAWLEQHAARAHDCADVGRAVLEGLRTGTFAVHGARALALAAFVQVGAAGHMCELTQVLRSVQK
ncbi:ParB/RepB/Spo0J family partition protein [Paraburkholderia tropica]|uniref:ParB/RepB/Spo0J family partition protein n=1 Tax=Paraburkholderia tropica TaxID=92647 RepID=UPI002AB76E67|nr:ParB/RepB/Spo0J family partition protein [Paraburkholderia tropica]